MKTWNTPPLQILFLATGLFVLLAASTPGCTSTEHIDTSEYRVIAYAGGNMDYWRMGAEKLTHINYAFALVNDDGEIYFRNEARSAAHLAQLQALKAKNPDLKLLVSVGGWGADGFSDAALTEESRELFARTGIDMVKQYGLDGIDINWEFPGQPGPGIVYRPEDQQNFTYMMRELRRQADELSDERGLSGNDRILVTIASNDNQRFFDYTEMHLVHQYLDFVNVMSYDMLSVGSRATGHHTGLFQGGPDAPSRTLESSVRIHLDAGIPREKIVIGAAFYGRGWTGVNPENNGLYQAVGEWYGAPAYSRIKAEYINTNGFTRYWDDTAKSPWVWNPESRTFISYDDPESLMHKARFVREMGLGGIMYWHHRHDPEEELLDAIYTHLNE